VPEEVQGIRKNFFSESRVIHWIRVPREAVVSASLGVFKTRLVRALGNLV